MKVKRNPLTCLKLNDIPAHQWHLKNGVLSGQSKLFRVEPATSQLVAAPAVLADYPLRPQGDIDE
jgi:hypothetical protein